MTNAIETITSSSNPRLKSAAALRETKARKSTGLILIDGEDILEHAVAGGVEITHMFFAQSGSSDESIQAETWKLRCPEARIAVVADGAMDKLQYGDRKLGVVAIGRRPDLSLEGLGGRIDASEAGRKKIHELAGLRSSAVDIYLVLDRMEKPGNLGAVLRSADAAGVKAVLLSDPISETWNPNAIRSSLGAIFCIPMAAAKLEEIQHWLQDRSVSTFAARIEDSVPYTEIKFPPSVAIVVGNEAEGLRGRWKSPSITPIRIPMFGSMDSLNASVSTSVILFEVVRQRGLMPS